MNENAPAPAVVVRETERGGGAFGGCFAKTIATIVIVLALGALAIWGVQRYIAQRLDPDPVSVASASLQGLREQNRLSAFAARFVAVVTSTQSRFGLSAKKTLIMPGMVRYEVDLGKLTQRDVTWDQATHTLGVTLPPVEADMPQVDMGAIQQYDSGGILLRLTDAEATLDAANRKAAQAELVKQARGPLPMKLARDATRRAVERSFALPLRAAGLEATVKVRFADEPSNDEVWDVSRSLQEVMRQPK